MIWKCEKWDENIGEALNKTKKKIKSKPLWDEDVVKSRKGENTQQKKKTKHINSKHLL